MPELMVVKVGGSLYEMPELGPRLQRWLADFAGQRVLVVPGGGAMADVIRDLDARHALGDERSHWLALRAMTLNGYVLTALLPGSRCVATPAECIRGLAVLDPLAFCLRDVRDDTTRALRHSWSVTSDSVAARVAVAGAAERLILLKSVDLQPDVTWEAAAQMGIVDAAFPSIVRAATGLEVQVVNFRRAHGVAP